MYNDKNNTNYEDTKAYVNANKVYDTKLIAKRADEIQTILEYVD